MAIATTPICARCDRAGRLISADEPLATLQHRCGGAIPGAIAIPALAEVVARSRELGLRIGRPLVAHDGEHVVRAWVEAGPAGDDATETALELHDWRTLDAASDGANDEARIRDDIDRALAEFTARLDSGQRVMSAEAHGTELAALATAMCARPGQPWTDFVSLPGNAHRQPLHWRLLDGAEVIVAGAGRRWRARLLPLGSSAEPSGFELSLTASEPQDNATPPPQRSGALIGSEIAPVLRQPIARIIANAETIRNRLAGPLAEEYRNYAGDIATAGQHLLDLVEDLSDLEVVESGGFSTAPDAIDLADVARRACGILSVRARESGITLLPPADDDALPATGEFRRVLQVLLNLIGNAIRYSPAGTRVTVLLSAAEGMARVTIADQGPGIAADDCARVFDKFERLGRGGDGGTGLGLYISRALAQAMGGDLSVTSIPGEGARFTLSVPAR